MAYELFIDGFDHYATADIVKKWHSNYAPFGSATYLISSGAGRRSTPALSISTGNQAAELTSKSFTPSRYVTVGFALYMPNVAAGAYIELHFWSVANRQCKFRLIALSGQWGFYREGAAIAQVSTNSINYDDWHYIECGVDLADAGSYELRVNGTSAGWLPSTNYDTLVTAGGQVTAISLYRPATSFVGTVYYDDLYIAYGNDQLYWLGDSRVDTLALTGDSTPQDWTPDTGNAWERLNADAGYIAADTVGDSSLFAAGNLSHTPSLIHGVQLNGLASKSDAGSRSAALLLKSGATTTEGDSLALSTDTLLIRQPYVLNPTSSSAWSKADVDGMEIGARVTA